MGKKAINTSAIPIGIYHILQNIPILVAPIDTQSEGRHEGTFPCHYIGPLTLCSVNYVNWPFPEQEMVYLLEDQRKETPLPAYFSLHSRIPIKCLSLRNVIIVEAWDPALVS